MRSTSCKQAAFRALAHRDQGHLQSRAAARAGQIGAILPHLAVAHRGRNRGGEARQLLFGQRIEQRSGRIVGNQRRTVARQQGGRAGKLRHQQGRIESRHLHCGVLCCPAQTQSLSLPFDGCV